FDSRVSAIWKGLPNDRLLPARSPLSRAIQTPLQSYLPAGKSIRCPCRQKLRDRVGKGNFDLPQALSRRGNPRATRRTLGRIQSSRSGAARYDAAARDG